MIDVNIDGVIATAASIVRARVAGRLVFHGRTGTMRKG